MNPKMIKFIKEWLTIAEEDLKWAKDTYADGHYARTCFVSQQVAEKSLKGFLYGTKENVKTHSLMRLMDLCSKVDPEFISLKENLLLLEPYYIGTRYPDIGDIERYNEQSLAEEALQSAEHILDFVKKKISK